MSIRLRRKKRSERPAYPKHFEVFHAEPATGGPTYRVYANSGGPPIEEGQISWKATCPHGESCWSQTPGAFFCAGTDNEPATIEVCGGLIHQVMPIAFLRPVPHLDYQGEAPNGTR